MDIEALDKAVACFEGGRTELAERLGVTPMSISHWYRRGLPVERAVEIEEATGRRVTRQELRPDIFGPIDEAAA